VLPKQTLVLAIVEKGAQGCLGSLANLVQPEKANIVTKILIKYYIMTKLFYKKMEKVIFQEDRIVCVP
jgi:hypothetical protein